MTKHPACRTVAAVVALGAALVACLPVLAAESLARPAWWVDRSVVTLGSTTNDFAACNVGQLAWFATNATVELDAVLPGGAGPNVLAKATSFRSTNHYAAANLGQLRAVAAPFWLRLAECGYTNTPPWAGTANAANDAALANLGQLKACFAFDPLRADGWWKNGHRFLTSWGWNNAGQLGDETRTDSRVPILVGTNKTWSTIVAGGEHTVAVDSDGQLWAWGGNSSGTLGDGTVVDRLLPVLIGPRVEWSQLAAGWHSTTALRSDGTLWMWGGDFGDGVYVGPPTVVRTVPTQVGTATNWSFVASLALHTVALKADGTLWTWGANWHGQLGNGSYQNRSSPTQVGTASDWASVDAGEGHTVAVKKDGTLWAWGDNNSYQIGSEVGYEGSPVPVQIGTETTWREVKAGCSHNLVQRLDGSLWSWGGGYYGELGLDSQLCASVPTRIGTATNWRQFDTGFLTSFAIKADGSLWSWGAPIEKCLGVSDEFSRYIPTRVGTASDWLSLSAGCVHIVAMRGTAGLSLWPQVRHHDVGGISNQSFTVLCGSAWTARSDDPWITVTSGATGIGNGSVRYAVSAAPTDRTGTISVSSGRERLAFVVTQGMWQGQDQDADGIPDDWEQLHGFDPQDSTDAVLDPDTDGLDNVGEWLAGTSPSTPDSDSDGLNDGDEVTAGMDPGNPDSDGDGLPDGWELANGLDPLDSIGSNGMNGDTDADGLANVQEFRRGTNPNAASVHVSVASLPLRIATPLREILP